MFDVFFVILVTFVIFIIAFNCVPKAGIEVKSMKIDYLLYLSLFFTVFPRLELK